MQYLELINNFWRIDEQKGFNGNTTRLYFFLLYIVNRSYWELDWLEYGDKKMRAILGISDEVFTHGKGKSRGFSHKVCVRWERQGLISRIEILTSKKAHHIHANFKYNLYICMDKIF